MNALDHLIAERRELLDLCRSLAAAEWEAPSLCAGWRVRDVVAHIVGGEHHLGEYLRALSIDGGNARMVARWKARPVGDLVRALEGIAEPGLFGRLLPRLALVDNWVHQQDIRRPLGHPRPQDSERLTLILGVARLARYGRVGGLHLVATDLDWERGRGLEVAGPAEALAMALMGRSSAAADLGGPGCTRLAYSSLQKD